MYWEGNEPSQDGKLTYSELLEKVCQVNIHSLLPKQLHVVLIERNVCRAWAV
jgi:hypothetical protein